MLTREVSLVNRTNKRDVMTRPDSKELSRLIELLCDVNYTYTDIDRKMMQEFPQLVKQGWKVGSTREKIKKYPILARTQAESRALLWRELGRSKIDGYKAISDALEAKKVAADGSEAEDHDLRLKASDRMLALMGENASPAGAKMNINVHGQDAKILIMSSEGDALPFPMREELRDDEG